MPWAELAPELLLLAMHRMRGRDLVRVGGVCRSWRAAAAQVCYDGRQAEKRVKLASMKTWLGNGHSVLPNVEQYFAARAYEFRSKMLSVVAEERRILNAACLKHDNMCNRLSFGGDVGCWCETRCRKSSASGGFMKENWKDAVHELGLRLVEKKAELAKLEAELSGH